MHLNLLISLILIFFSLVFLAIQKLTHSEFMLHLAAIPIEILVAVFIVDHFLKQREQKEKRRQLMYIKSCMFRSEMRDLFITNFASLKYPALSFEKIRGAKIEELKYFRKQAESIEYLSLESMESIIEEYIRASTVWHAFLERAMNYGFETIVQDMITIIHFIHDIKALKGKNLEKSFIKVLEISAPLFEKTKKIFGDGIRAFLDYAIELKENQPRLFDEVFLDYP